MWNNDRFTPPPHCGIAEEFSQFTHTSKHTRRCANPRKPCNPQEEAVVSVPGELAGCNFER